MFFTRYLIVYDVCDSKRIERLFRLLKGYVYRVQNSVFEGNLTQSQFYKVKEIIKKIIDLDKDSVIIYPLTLQNVKNKEVIGKEVHKNDFIF